MLIKDLPKRLQEMVLENMKLQRIDNRGRDFVVNSFDWIASPQGHKFWADIDQGIIPEEYKETINNSYSIF